MEIKLVNLQFNIEEDLSLNYGHYLRGYFSNRYSEVLFHNHLGDGQYRFGYPLIQYKIIEGKPVVMGIEAGADLVTEHFLDFDELTLGDQTFVDFEQKMEVVAHELVVAPDLRYSYQFITPWMALNQKNYKRYQREKAQAGFDETLFFQKLLVGNILSFAKAMNWWVDTRIFTLPQVKMVPVKFKNQKMLGFVGDFYTNVELPNYIGLGNSTARGFGTIKRQK